MAWIQKTHFVRASLLTWFDRAYKYDHVGRLKEATTYRRAHGLSAFPAINYPDPYYQNVSYDSFNHASRTGLFYTGEPSDVGAWVNNKRIDPGWTYDADVFDRIARHGCTHPIDWNW